MYGLILHPWLPIYRLQAPQQDLSRIAVHSSACGDIVLLWKYEGALAVSSVVEGFNHQSSRPRRAHLSTGIKVHPSTYSHSADA